MDNNIFLELRGVSKEFPGVKALKEVSFTINKGEVHALIGGNGAGKSTLMKILSGAYTKNAGTIIVDGQETEIGNPNVAEALGITIIYQELNLVQSLTVAENIFIGRHPKTSANTIDWQSMNQQAAQLLEEFEIDIAPQTTVRSISIAQQQMVEIIKAVSKNARLVIMDEPTSSLTSKEITVLFRMIRRLKEKGVAVIFISHRLDEIFEISDRITIMRDGAYVDTRDVDKITRNELISLMIGREMSQQFPDRQSAIGPELLRAENITDGVLLQDISFTLHEGEVLGFAGLVGAGRTELMHTIFGSRKRKGGSLYMHGKEIGIRSPKHSIRNGIGFVTEDRKQEGLALKLTVRENVCMVAIKKVLQNGLINRKKEIERTKHYIDALNIVTPSEEQRAVFLSGGNQQKVVLSKWMMSDCSVVVMDEPTRGIDVGAKREIYEIINQMVADKKGIIVVSSEFDEVMGICDRIIVMCEGRITGVLTKEEFSQEKIAALAVGEVL